MAVDSSATVTMLYRHFAPFSMRMGFWGGGGGGERERESKTLVDVVPLDLTRHCRWLSLVMRCQRHGFSAPPPVLSSAEPEKEKRRR